MIKRFVCAVTDDNNLDWWDDTPFIRGYFKSNPHQVENFISFYQTWVLRGLYVKGYNEYRGIATYHSVIDLSKTQHEDLLLADMLFWRTNN